MAATIQIPTGTGVAERIVHQHVVVPSLTALSSLLYQPGDEALPHVSEMIKHFSADVRVLGKVSSEGGPTVLVSRRMFPDADHEFAADYLKPLEVLGSKRDRRDALEVPVAEELRSLLGPHGFRVTRWSEAFHEDCNDITVIGPNREMFNLEVRNYRSEIHDLVKPVDVDAISRDRRRGITTVFVVPRCTGRFRRIVEGLGARVIETNVYVTTTEEQRSVLEGFGFMSWAVELASVAAPRIAEQITMEILGDRGRRIEPEHIEVIEERRYAPRGRSSERVERAMELYREGVTSMAGAAERMGVSRSTLQRAFRAEGQPTPWSHGGQRSGAGRSRFQEVILAGPPPAGGDTESRQVASHPDHEHGQRAKTKERRITSVERRTADPEPSAGGPRSGIGAEPLSGPLPGSMRRPAPRWGDGTSEP